jgi:hypothetical protein
MVVPGVPQRESQRVLHRRGGMRPVRPRSLLVVCQGIRLQLQEDRAQDETGGFQVRAIGRVLPQTPHFSFSAHSFPGDKYCAGPSTPPSCPTLGQLRTRQAREEDDDNHGQCFRVHVGVVVGVVPVLLVMQRGAHVQNPIQRRVPDRRRAMSRGRNRVQELHSRSKPDG